MPWTVRMYCGCRGLGSIFWRSHATWTSTVRVDGIDVVAPHLVEQLLAGERRASMLDEVLQKLKLAR